MVLSRRMEIQKEKNHSDRLMPSPLKMWSEHLPSLSASSLLSFHCLLRDASVNTKSCTGQQEEPTPADFICNRNTFPKLSIRSLNRLHNFFALNSSRSPLFNGVAVGCCSAIITLYLIYKDPLLYHGFTVEAQQSLRQSLLGVPRSWHAE